MIRPDPKPSFWQGLGVLGAIAVLAWLALSWLLFHRMELPSMPPMPSVVDGPAEPVYRRDTWCPQPDAGEEPEPGLSLELKPGEIRSDVDQQGGRRD